MRLNKEGKWIVLAHLSTCLSALGGCGLALAGQAGGTRSALPWMFRGWVHAGDCHRVNFSPNASITGVSTRLAGVLRDKAILSQKATTRQWPYWIFFEDSGPSWRNDPLASL